MIHHELGCAYVLDREGAKVTIDPTNPRDLSMAAEESVSGDAMACAIEAVRDWLAWIYEAGPHPVPVMRRLVACTSENAPWLLQGLASRDVRAVTATTAETDSLRIVCGSTLRAVQKSLSRAYRREGLTWDAVPHITTIEMRLMMESAIDPEDSLIRAKAMEAWLARVWDAGPRLGEAMKALYVEARSIAPELILNMSGDEIAQLFNQGRAAESARVKQRVNAVLIRAGFRRATLRFQKSVSACRTYAAKARGNKNRAKSARPAATAAA